MTRRRILLSLFLTILIPLTAVLYNRVFMRTGGFLRAPPVPMSQSAPSPVVIVVGAGLAGLSAAYEALRVGASVRLLERAAKPGGNSIKASSGINGAPTRFQKGQDTSFYSDTVRSAGVRLSSGDVGARKDRESLIALLTNKSASAVDFLVDDIGVDLSVVAQLGGHSFARTHRGAGKTPPGAAIIFALLDKLKAFPNFELKTGCEVTRLLSAEPSKVTGVEFVSDGQTQNLDGPVVFTTGGFAGDAKGLLAKYRPDLSRIPSTNDPRPGMHNLLTSVGASLVDMDSVQIHPTGFVDPANPDAPVKFLAAEMLRGEGGILLHKGKRFVNEMETREYISNVIMKLPGSDTQGGDSRQWDVQILLDPGACEVAGPHVGFYTWKGLVTKQKVKELDATTRDTIRAYSAIVAGDSVDEYGRKVFGHWKLTGAPTDDDQEVCVGRVTPIIHFTMGGVAINEQAEVLASDLGSQQKPVQGLWAAGEITGGIHGDNRLGGSSLLECVVVGRIAGGNAGLFTQ